MSEQTTETWPGHVSTPWQVPWPEGTIARYWTVAGATVDVTGNGDLANYQCTGCPYNGGGWAEYIAHERAQAHAETCRALPRPAVNA